MPGLMIEVADLVNGYRDVVNAVLRNGHEATPRGEPTVEVLGATIVVADPMLTLPIGVGRGVSTKVAAVEALQLVGGFTDPVLTTKASSAFDSVKDGGAFHGAYGPRAAPQFPRVIDRLRADPHSRRAVVNIWDPALDLYREGLHDYPCTMTLEYTVRNGTLVAQTHMRSNDVWLGLAYDAFVFTQVQLTICHILGVEPGPYIHHASSLHIYRRDVTRAKMLAVSPELPTNLPVGLMCDDWDAAQRIAWSVVYAPVEVEESSGADWYVNALKEIR